MPVTPTYPGVYIQELPSSVHTIVGVPTSVAAFVGYAARGPCDSPQQCNGWADYERAFGGLDPKSPMSYAAFLFFLNGGNIAQVVRASSTDGSQAPAKIAISADVILVATSPGTWGDDLVAVVDTNQLLTPDTTFNLTLTDPGSGTTESYKGLSLSTGPLAITTALSASQLMSVDSSSKLDTMPAAGTYGVPAAAGGGAGGGGGGGGGGGAGGGAGGGGAGGGKAAAPPAGGSAGVDVDSTNLAIPGDQGKKTGIYSLVKADIFNMLCLPSAPTSTYSADTLSTVAAFCAQQRAMLIVDPPSGWIAAAPPLSFETVTGTPSLTGPNTANAAVYYPNIEFSDPVTKATVQQGPCGAVAGVWASTDDARGVWKAPAGTAAAIAGISDLAVHIDDGESGVLNPIAVNCLRNLPLIGPVSWGARTVAGADQLASQWKYIPVRRTALFIEESLRRGTQWVLFEPNAEPTWSAIRLNVGAFMNGLYKQGAFGGATPSQAYLVQCDASNNPQANIDQGILTILVGFQPLYPAEFVVIQIEQLAGQLS
jgi:Bacteriophage tail sheath protein